MYTLVATGEVCRHQHFCSGIRFEGHGGHHHSHQRKAWRNQISVRTGSPELLYTPHKKVLIAYYQTLHHLRAYYWPHITVLGLGYTQSSGHHGYIIRSWDFRAWSVEIQPVFMLTSFGFVLRHELKFQLQKNLNYNQPGRANATRVESRNNVHLRFVHPSDDLVTPGHNKVFDLPSQIEFVRCLLVFTCLRCVFYTFL